MKRYSRSLMLATFAITVAGGLFAAHSSDRQSNLKVRANLCRYENTVGFPAWFSSGVWNGNRLLIVDNIEGDLLEVSNNGVATDLRAAIGDYLASSVVRISSGGNGKGSAPIVVELVTGKLLYLDNSLRPQREAAMPSIDHLVNGRHRPIHLLDWTLIGDGTEVFGYADIESPTIDTKYRWINGFVRFNLERPTSFTTYRERLFPDDLRVVMRMGYPLMTSIGSTAYVALPEEPMRLWRFNPNDEENSEDILLTMRGSVLMGAFPAHLVDKLAPVLPSFRTVEEHSRTMKLADQTTMPTGLWGWENTLFLLSRVSEAEKQSWFLSKIDPLADKILWTVRIPGSAQRMAVIPGRERWAFIEKTPVAPLNEITHHIRFVESSQMRSRSLKSLCN